MTILDLDYTDELIRLCLDIDQIDGDNGNTAPVWREYSIDNVLPNECLGIDDGCFLIPNLEYPGMDAEREVVDMLPMSEHLRMGRAEEILFELGLLKRYRVNLEKGFRFVYAENMREAAEKAPQAVSIDPRPSVYSKAEVMAWEMPQTLQVTIVEQSLVKVA